MSFADVTFLHGISGFTRRLVLQLLLENEKHFVFIKGNVPLQKSSLAAPTSAHHPKYGVGHHHQLLYVSTQMTCGDIIKHISGKTQQWYHCTILKVNIIYKVTLLTGQPLLTCIMYFFFRSTYTGKKLKDPRSVFFGGNDYLKLGLFACIRHNAANIKIIHMDTLFCYC